jgi:hypothetical protein
VQRGELPGQPGADLLRRTTGTGHTEYADRNQRHGRRHVGGRPGPLPHVRVHVLVLDHHLAGQIADADAKLQPVRVGRPALPQPCPRSGREQQHGRRVRHVPAPGVALGNQRAAGVPLDPGLAFLVLRQLLAVRRLALALALEVLADVHQRRQQAEEQHAGLLHERRQRDRADHRQQHDQQREGRLLRLLRLRRQREVGEPRRRQQSRRPVEVDQATGWVRRQRGIRRLDRGQREHHRPDRELHAGFPVGPRPPTARLERLAVQLDQRRALPRLEHVRRLLVAGLVRDHDRPGHRVDRPLGRRQPVQLLRPDGDVSGDIDRQSRDHSGDPTAEQPDPGLRCAAHRVRAHPEPVYGAGAGSTDDPDLHHAMRFRRHTATGVTDADQSSFAQGRLGQDNPGIDGLAVHEDRRQEVDRRRRVVQVDDLGRPRYGDRPAHRLDEPGHQAGHRQTRLRVDDNVNADRAGRIDHREHEPHAEIPISSYQLSDRGYDAPVPLVRPAGSSSAR